MNTGDPTAGLNYELAAITAAIIGGTKVKGGTYALYTTPGEKELKQTRDTVAEVADNIRAGHFPAKQGFYCYTCDYKSICPEYEGG